MAQALTQSSLLQRRAFKSSGIIIALVLVVLMEASAFLLNNDPLEILVTGLALGALYAVVALGYTMVYGIIELINFAHGDIFGLGAFISLMVFEKMAPSMVAFQTFMPDNSSINLFGLHLHGDVLLMSIVSVLIAMLIAAVLCGIAGVLVERIAYRPLRNAPKLAPLITAIGMSFIIENLLFQWRGGIPIGYPSVFPSAFVNGIGPLKFTTPVSNIDLIAIGSALILMFFLDRFVNQTMLGKAMRAVAQDAEAALMMGINVDRIIAVTFFVGSALAGAGAVIYGLHENTIGSTMGFSLGLFAFTAAVLGGIGNIRGAMLGGLLIGIIKRWVDTLGGGKGTEWADAVVFAILILVLVFRPSGLLGSQIPDKV